jgi:hypothetical protein
MTLITCVLGFILSAEPASEPVSFETQIKTLAKQLAIESEFVTPFTTDELLTALPDSIEGKATVELIKSKQETDKGNYVEIQWLVNEDTLGLIIYDTGYHGDLIMGLLALTAAIGDFATQQMNIYTVDYNELKVQLSLNGDETNGYAYGKIGYKIDNRIFIIGSTTLQKAISKADISNQLASILAMVDIKKLEELLAPPPATE